MKSERGQAIIFGLLFLAVVVMALLILYNQSQLVDSRVQLENTADATVYSQAKLAARNQNFIAYTNRSMVANEASIGQMVSLLSWAKHYGQVGAFISYPAYRFPIAPPSPTTFANVLRVTTLPYKIMGTAVSKVAKPMVKAWTTVISYFNSTIGVFQKMFALSTLIAQVEVSMKVVKDHEDDPDNPKMYIPAVGWYFFTQNALLTYFGENFRNNKLQTLIEKAKQSNAFGASASALTEDFLKDQTVGELNSMISDNSPGLKSKRSKNSTGGRNKNVNTGKAAEANAVDAYKRFAAIVNYSRGDFSKDRHWELFPTIPDIFPRITLPLGIVTLTIDLDFTVGAGLKNDGGTAYISKSALEKDSDIPRLGWSAIDVLSFGVEFDVGLYVEVKICLLGSCSSYTLLDFNFVLPIGFPLGGATHQVVSNNKYAKKILSDWGVPFQVEPDKYGRTFDGFHLQTLAWGQASPMLLPGMYGLRKFRDVTDTYAGPPSFFSLGEGFQKPHAESYEFTAAVAKSLDDVQTSDNKHLHIDSKDADWDKHSDKLQYTSFDVKTHSRTEGKDYAGSYQSLIWGDHRPMMTISSAETYFANPMQSVGGEVESASLFSPFWDARLREPSAVATLIATGEIDFTKIIEGLGNDAVDMVGWLLAKVGERIVDTSVDYMMKDIPPPVNTILSEPVKDIAKKATDKAAHKAVEELDDFVP